MDWMFYILTLIYNTLKHASSNAQGMLFRKHNSLTWWTSGTLTRLFHSQVCPRTCPVRKRPPCWVRSQSLQQPHPRLSIFKEILKTISISSGAGSSSFFNNGALGSKHSCRFCRPTEWAEGGRTYSPFWNATTPTSCITKGSSGAMLRAWPKNLSASFELLVKPYSSPIYSIGKWHLKVLKNVTYSASKTR